MENGNISFWYQNAGEFTARPRLASDIEADVVIVGAGYTGLWSAYYLKKAKPELEIVIVDAEKVGFGASGRNGGWITNGMPGLHSQYAKSHGAPAVAEFQRHLFQSVEEIVRVSAEEGIDADIAYDGEIAIATNPAQMCRLEEEYAESSKWGYGEGDLVPIDREGLAQFARLDNALGGLYSPHGARVQPAKLVRGLAEVVERLGVKIFESTKVARIEPRVAVTTKGLRLSGQYVIRGTEAYSNSIEGHKRDWLPKLSSMIVTEPLSDSAIAEIGWQSGTLVRDVNHFFSYIQKTADNRIALGGPGSPYLFGSGWDDNGKTMPVSIEMLKRRVHQRFPPLGDVEFSHTWTGVLGIPRNWSGTVNYDAQTGLAVAGGYVGDGVASSNLAARTLRDLILNHSTEITRLPWVGSYVRKWELEPLRWVALRGMYRVYSLADRFEEKSSSSRTSWLARAANMITGRR